MKKQDSYKHPPKKPFFKQITKGKATVQDSLSPGKKIQYRSQCIDQLDKWHSLMEHGAISLDQYSEMQSTILGDLKKFWVTVSAVKRKRS